MFVSNRLCGQGALHPNGDFGAVGELDGSKEEGIRKQWKDFQDGWAATGTRESSTWVYAASLFEGEGYLEAKRLGDSHLILTFRKTWWIEVETSHLPPNFFLLCEEIEEVYHNVFSNLDHERTLSYEL